MCVAVSCAWQMNEGRVKSPQLRRLLMPLQRTRKTWHVPCSMPCLAAETGSAFLTEPSLPRQEHQRVALQG